MIAYENYLQNVKSTCVAKPIDPSGPDRPVASSTNDNMELTLNLTVSTLVVVDRSMVFQILNIRLPCVLKQF